MALKTLHPALGIIKLAIDLGVDILKKECRIKYEKPSVNNA